MPLFTSLRPRAPRAVPAVVAGGRVFPIVICRHRQSRRYLLRVTPAGTLRLTVPRGASISGGVRFAHTQTAWILREWQRQAQANRPWMPGTAIWYRGEKTTIEARGDVVALGGETIPGRPAGDLRAHVESHLRAVAAGELPARCHAFANRCRVSAARVTVRNQRSRWGACSARGAITLNWRLVQMPPAVSDYVILHELMHLKQPNHSPKFWREVEAVCPGWRDAERWLRRHGKELI